MNAIVDYFNLVRPKLKQAPEHERVAFILQHVIYMQKGKYDWDEVTDALAEFVPEQREFWFRVQATWNTHFIESMTHFMNERD